MCKNDKVARLSELLAAPDLHLKQVTLGADDPDIRWVSTTELVDPSPYLEGGEVVLTTGLSHVEDDSQWLDFVSNLSRANVAAIGFAIGVNHAQTPAGLVQAASALQVAVFEVPRPTPFIAVSKAVADLVASDELASARRALTTQRHILNQAFSNQGTAGVLARLAAATDSQAAVIRGDGSVESATSGFIVFDELLNAVRSLRGDANRASLGASTPERAWLLHPLGLHGSSHRYLAIVGEHAPTPAHQGAITAATLVLSLEDTRQRAELDLETERRERVTQLLIDERVAEARAAVDVLWPEQGLPERVRAVVLTGSDEQVDAFMGEVALGLTAHELIVRNDAQHVTVLCSAGDEPNFVAKIANGRGLDCVIGREAELERVRTSWVSAWATALGLGQSLQPRTVLVDEGSVLLQSLATLPHDQLRREVLGRLAESTDECVMLRETLRAFLAANGQSGPAAASLNVHRNTLRHRLERIEGLTNRSLANADDRAELWLALRLGELS